MAKFKVGDRVKCVYNDNGSTIHVGQEGHITRVGTGFYLYSVSFASSDFSEPELELLNKSIENMSIIEKAKLAFKAEPEKSLIKAGILDSGENLTKEGNELFTKFLFEKNKLEFKKEVVDPILAEESSK